MARVNKCCCCSLKTGTLIIAILGWVFTLIRLFALVGAGLSNYQPPEDGTGEEGNNATSLGLKIGYSVVSFIICVLLFVGVHKKQASFFLPWLILACIEAVLCTLGTILIFVLIFLSGPHFVAFIIIFIFALLTTVLSWYFWTVVYSYYHVVKDDVVQPTGGNVYYSPTSVNPPPYDKDRTQIA